MAINYRQTDTNATCADGQYCLPVSTGTVDILKLASDGGTAGVTEATGSHFANASDQRDILFEIVPAAGTTWAAGNWTVRLNVTTANMNLTWDTVYICRVNSSCVSQATIASATGLAISCGTTGVKSTTVSGAVQTPGAGDKIVVLLEFDNGSMTTQTFGITPNQLIDSPFTAASVGYFPPFPQPVYIARS